MLAKTGLVARLGSRGSAVAHRVGDVAEAAEDIGGGRDRAVLIAESREAEVPAARAYSRRLSRVCARQRRISFLGRVGPGWGYSAGGWC